LKDAGIGHLTKFAGFKEVKIRFLAIKSDELKFL
jgi:hypothetical protein